MKCYNCGHENEDSALYCEKCTAYLKRPQQTQQITTNNATQQTTRRVDNSDNRYSEGFKAIFAALAKTFNYDNVGGKIKLYQRLYFG